MKGVDHRAARYSAETRRYALWLHWICGMSFRKVGREIGCGADTVQRWRDEFERAVALGVAKPIGHLEFELGSSHGRRVAASVEGKGNDPLPSGAERGSLPCGPRIVHPPSEPSATTF